MARKPTLGENIEEAKARVDALVAAKKRGDNSAANAEEKKLKDLVDRIKNQGISYLILLLYIVILILSWR